MTVPELIPRLSVPAIDQILGKPFPVLDAGFVRVVDYMGSDEAIVQAARISYGAGTRRLHEDRGLIRYLMRHHHTTPFEMCELKLHVRAPMDCWRQWIRHRTANVNEYSTRYSVAIDAMQKTSPTAWRKQATGNRQGSGSNLPESSGRLLSDREVELQGYVQGVYKERLEAGVAREQARKDLPLSTYTEAYWKIDLHNLFHFLRLRLDDHAQEEIRSYASVIATEIVAQWCPEAWASFVEYRLEAISLFRTERRLIALLLAAKPLEAIALARNEGWLAAEGAQLTRHRERTEFEAKLVALGLKVPWGPSDAEPA